ncbi:hypothetical protein A4A49_20252 [Nicotiana attenuata]|uniref:RNase H type-1 domain-containing protein n=1 Tax=Nicotiana attenuata TaxID=49451 RepID=A0A314KR11_NICAT|nr:hypothetical protein A4A49_20252 [Nicotiana attenuata]
MVTWINPEEDNWKLNSDGSCMMMMGKAGAGGIVRRGNGDMVMAYANPIQFLTNKFSELQAALFGIIWCCEQQFNKLTVELDSLLVVQMIQGKAKPPCRLHNDLTTIKEKISHRDIEVCHCFREGNTVADSLAKHATAIMKDKIYMQENDLPCETKGYLRMDKLQMPSFRIRATKHPGWFFEPP